MPAHGGGGLVYNRQPKTRACDIADIAAALKPHPQPLHRTAPKPAATITNLDHRKAIPEALRPYMRGRDPQTAKLIRDIKSLVDPRRRLNPGSLGL